MKKVKYNFIDHTADFGIEVTGEDQKTLFANAALAMFDVIANTSRLKGESEVDLRIQGSDRCDLMVNWLRELLYLWNGKEMLIKEVDILSISEKKLTAVLKYDRFNPDIHEIKNEIKAVTYHQIKVEQTQKGWTA
ncbi:MAG: archease, partial [Desulfobacterales bacterium]|nr:archease [Desulfobacterales bacterium]